MRLPLASLGYPGYATALMRAAHYSMATLHVLDSTHLLFTYSLRRLVPRLPGDDTSHEDRIVAAEIIALPSGSVVARTTWRTHDHGRYLWRAGQDMFVVRSQDQLFTFAPLRGLASGAAFEQVLLPHRPGMPQLIASSADGRILTLETEQEKSPSSMGDDEVPKRHKTIEFYRIVQPANTDDPIQVEAAGAVGAHQFLRLALDGDGYLWAEEQAHNMYRVSFNEYEGKPHDIAEVHSFCAPRMSLLSRGEFLAETCGGASQTPMIATYGFDGHENWEEPLGDEMEPLSIVTAPRAGRFAISRLMANAGGSELSGLAAADPLAQEIRVYQTGSGDELLRLGCASPVRSGENFDLAPDGGTLAVLDGDAIQVYRLPALTERDRKDLADVALMAPPMARGPVNLRRIVQPILPDPEEAGEPGSTAAADAGSTRRLLVPEKAEPPAAAPAASMAALKPAGASPEPGVTRSEPARSLPEQTASQPADQPATPARRPPTLLEPGEKAEFKGAAAGPQ